MAQSFEESLFQAIKNDDIKAFNALTENARCGAYRLGRFPVLSLLYLYKSRKILSAYEEKFLKITVNEPLGEPTEISSKFAQRAGKCLRLYLNETVSPLEMLLILDKTRRLKRVYPLTKPSSAVKSRLQSIYKIRYSLNVKFEGNSIIIDRRPLSYREKKNIVTACVSVLLVAAVAVGAPLTTIALIPEPKPDEFAILKEELASKEDYTLTRDIVLPENFAIEKVNCKIIGGGKKLTLRKGASLGEFNGELSDVTIETAGDPIFTTVSEGAVIKDMTVKVNASVSSAASTALVALTNYGTIEGVNVAVSGSITSLGLSSGTVNSLTFGGIVLNNAYKYNYATNKSAFGTVKNCTVNYSSFSLKGAASADSAFGGIAGANNGELLNCTVTGEITADTFDLAGISVTNSGLLSGDINEAKLSQTSESGGWSPNVCGIVYGNSYAVEYCENRGSISAVSTYEPTGEDDAPVVIAAGISCMNYAEGYVAACRNSGAVTAGGKGTAFAGGISARSYAAITNCVSGGDITVTADSLCAGGILGFSIIYSFGYAGSADSCISSGKINITATGEDPSYAGGIVGLVQESTAYSSTFGGRINNCFFLGECHSERIYYGNIVGVCGANLYESNSYTFGPNEYTNFKDNYYIENSFKAFGAAAATGEDNQDVYTSVEDKGAATATPEEIENSENYKLILSKMEK